MVATTLKTDRISNNSGASQSLWMEVQLPSFPQLVSNTTADICIVGAGIAGLTCAYTLAKQGKSVVVLDQGAIAGGQTARTTAHLTWVLDDHYYHLEKMFGANQARLAADSHSAAIDYIEKIIQEEGIDCDFERVDGYLFSTDSNMINSEFTAVRKTGNNVFKLDRAPFNSFDTGPCLHFPRQAQFHILKYLRGLIQAILAYGGKIYSDTHVNHVKERTPCLVTTQNGATVSSKSVIVATFTPINNRLYIHSKQAPYRTYVIAASIPKGSVPKGLYWDNEDPYHYIRTHPHQSDENLDWLIVGGEDHKTGQDKRIEAKYQHLEKWTRRRFPKAGKIEYQWSGQVFEPIDSLGFIGQNPGNDNIFIVTGDSGNGMTNGTIAGILLPDLILGKVNLWKNLYEPSRKTFSATPQFAKEAFNIAKQYADWFTPGEKKKIEELDNDEGFILRKGIKKLAIYKDTDNKIHINSAFCPHLGGCVRWNPGEKSWDCPCHGSRFNGCGEVITGPANSDLFPCEQEEI
jgi:glycine/D-amino acid oxidase-like deaminating enzyme/nitrite reductase/ring-hydroxylating ferredoxin subunit